MRGMPLVRRPTLHQHGVERLRRLCPVLGFDRRDEEQILAVFGRMAATWGKRRCGGHPRWPSDITDDHSPFELSVAIDGETAELRILAEIQAEVPTMTANWEAALRFNADIESTFGVSLERFRAIEDLFRPSFATPRFGLWHAVCFRPGAPPDFKLYLNPFVRGKSGARAVVEEAMARLGFEHAGEMLPAQTPQDVTLYFSLDLPARDPLDEAPRSLGPESRPSISTEFRESLPPGLQRSLPRVKAYTGHFNASPEHVEQALQTARGYSKGQVAEFCRVMGGGPASNARPVQTCLSFTAGAVEPTSGTVYFPVRSHADSDLEVSERVLSFIHPEGIPIYRAALEAFTNRPLEDGVGMQSYVSLRQAPGRRRLTVYLSPEIYRVQGAPRGGAASGVMSRVRDAGGSRVDIPRSRAGRG